MKIGRGFAAGLATGAAVGRQLAQDWRTAQMNEELSQVMAEKPEESTGYTEDQAKQLDAAAKSGQYDVAYDQEKGAYTVTPKAGGETGTLSPVQRTVFMGKTFDKPMTEGQQDQARLAAMSGVMAKFGNPAEAMRLKQMGQQAQLTDLQIKGAQRQDNRDQRDDDFRTRTQKVVDEWNTGLLGDDGKPREPTAAETLDLGLQLAKLNAEFGKGNPLDMAAIQKQISSSRDEGTAKAVAYLHMTGDVKGAEQLFNASGAQKVTLDPNSLQKVQLRIGGHTIPSYAIAGTDASGKPFKIGNTWGELVRGMTTAELAGMPFKVEELDLKRQQVGNEGARIRIAQGEADRAAERWKIEKPELEARASDTKAQRDARKELSDAIESGDEQKVEKARQKAVAAGIKLDKPNNEFTWVPSQGIQGGGTLVNKDNGVAVMYDGAGKPLANIAPPGKAATSTAVPPPAERKVGQTYDTPRGKMIWRGAGWEPVK